MITLQSLTHLADNTFYAKWRDEADGIGYDFAAIHDSDGRLQVCNMNLRPPRLTPVQMETAVPDRHPAYELAERGAAANPDRAERMMKAARIVETGGVTLTSADTARVGSYDITATSCTCPDHQHRESWCKHRLAARMARALGQLTVHMDSDAPAELTDAEIRRRKQEWQAKRNAEFARRQREDDRSFRRWCQTSEGGRRYVLKAAANGRIAATPDSKLHARQQQANKYQDSPELAAAKAAALANVRAMFAGD